jgi:hypothetical protein
VLLFAIFGAILANRVDLCQRTVSREVPDREALRPACSASKGVPFSHVTAWQFIKCLSDDVRLACDILIVAVAAAVIEILQLYCKKTSFLISCVSSCC